YNVTSTGSILGEVDAIAVTGIAWDGSNLFFVDRTGYFTKRSADAQTVLEAFAIPSTEVGVDMAYDSKRKVLWRLSHRPTAVEQIDPNSHLLLRAFRLPQNDPLPDSQGGLGSIGPLGIAYDPTRDKLYVSFCASGCKDGVVGGIVDSLDPTQLLTEPSAPFIFGLLTYSVPTTDLSDSDLTLLFRTSAFLTGGLASDPSHRSLVLRNA